MIATLVYPGFKLEVTDSSLPTAKVEEDTITVSLNLIKADIEYRLLGELLSSILMYPYIEAEGSEGEIRVLAEKYREKAVIDTLKEAISSLGDLYSTALLTPLYPLARKAETIGGLLSRLYVEMNNNPGEKARVIGFYKRLLDSVDGLEYADGFYRITSPGEIKEYKTTAGIAIPSLHRPLMNKLARHTVEKLWGPDIRVSGEHLRVGSTRFYLKCGSPSEAASKYMECSEKPTCKSGHIISSSILCSCNGSRVVVKDYAHMGGKWVVFKIMAKPMVEYRVNPRDRLTAEFQAMEKLRGIRGVVTPLFYEVCTPSQYRAMAIREFLEGKTLRELGEEEEWEKAGRALGTIHSNNVTLGDANPGNFLATPSGDTGVVDAEQSHSYTLKTGSWDIVTFLSTSLFWRVGENLITSFLEGYAETAPKPREVFELASRAYSWIGILPTVPHIYVQSKRILGKMLSSNS